MDKQYFTLTPAHLLLISNMNIDYNDHMEFGAPAVDPKRPYGNSDVYGDIASILTVKRTEDEDHPYTEKDLAYMLTVHKETATALQVILSSMSFEVGVYEADKYCRNWRLAERGNE